MAVTGLDYIQDETTGFHFYINWKGPGSYNLNDDFLQGASASISSYGDTNDVRYIAKSGKLELAAVKNGVRGSFSFEGVYKDFQGNEVSSRTVEVSGEFAVIDDFNEFVGEVECKEAYSGPEFDIQFDSQCKAAFYYQCVGETELMNIACDTYSSFQDDNPGMADCPYCN